LIITGPQNATGVSETPVRRAIFVCQPETSLAEEPCAKQIISGLAAHAFRRPETPEDLESLMELYEIGRKSGGFDNGIRLALQAILADPQFIFRLESSAATAGITRIRDLELASRLSFFLWSSLPDEELIGLASEGKLGDPDVIGNQIRRMLADSRSQALVTSFVPANGCA
jgi:hypothetical protein